MKRNDQFVIEKIENSIYLLPVGQLIADLNKGIKINETCEFVWNQLAEEISFEELIEKCIVRFAVKFSRYSVGIFMFSVGKEIIGHRISFPGIIYYTFDFLLNTLPSGLSCGLYFITREIVN